MVTFSGFSELREFAVTPIIVTTVNNHSANRRTVTANPFRGRFHHDICSVFNWTEQITCGTKGIIYDEWQIMFLGKGGDGFKIRNVKSWVTDRLKVDCFGFFVDVFFERFNLVAFSKTDVDAETFERNLKLVICSSVKKRRRNKIVS